MRNWREWSVRTRVVHALTHSVVHITPHACPPRSHHPHPPHRIIRPPPLCRPNQRTHTHHLPSNNQQQPSQHTHHLPFPPPFLTYSLVDALQHPRYASLSYPLSNTFAVVFIPFFISTALLILSPSPPPLLPSPSPPAMPLSSPELPPLSAPLALSDGDVALLTRTYSDIFDKLRRNRAACRWIFQWLLTPHPPHIDATALDLSISKGYRTAFSCTHPTSPYHSSPLQNNSTLLLPVQSRDTLVLGYYVESSSDNSTEEPVRIGKYVYCSTTRDLLKVSKVRGPPSSSGLLSTCITRTVLVVNGMFINDFVMLSFPWQSPVDTVPLQCILHSRTFVFYKMLQTAESADFPGHVHNSTTLLAHSFYGLTAFGVYEPALVPAQLSPGMRCDTAQIPLSLGSWAVPEYFTMSRASRLFFMGMFQDEILSLRSQFVRRYTQSPLPQPISHHQFDETATSPSSRTQQQPQPQPQPQQQQPQQPQVLQQQSPHTSHQQHYAHQQQQQQQQQHQQTQQQSQHQHEQQQQAQQHHSTPTRRLSQRRSHPAQSTIIATQPLTSQRPVSYPSISYGRYGYDKGSATLSGDINVSSSFLPRHTAPQISVDNIPNSSLQHSTQHSSVLLQNPMPLQQQLSTSHFQASIEPSLHEAVPSSMVESIDAAVNVRGPDDTGKHGSVANTTVGTAMATPVVSPTTPPATTAASRKASKRKVSPMAGNVVAESPSPTSQPPAQPSPGPLVKKTLPAPTKNEIVIRNRISAQRSNEKRRQKIEKTKKTLAYLKNTYLPQLQTKRDTLFTENRSLRLKFIEKYHETDIDSYFCSQYTD